MTRRLRRLAVCAAAVLVLAACADSDGGLGPGAVDVDVDTAELRALKKEAGIADCTAPTEDPVDNGLPDLELPCLGGGPEVSLAALRGPMVVNFWASWCGPCRRELPHYQAFSEEYAGTVAVLGIDYNDTRPDAALELARDAGVTYPSLADPATGLAEEGLQIPGLPAIAFIDADGRMTKLVFEEIDSVRELEELVDEHLGVSAP